MKIVIVIPVYKERISYFEEISLVQCLRILSKYNLCIITYRELNIDKYLNILNAYDRKYSLEYFEKEYFSSIDGYNKLLLCKSFYLRFKDYDYMLIYQLDAFVFKDELAEWCEKDYDYIGAPWYEDFKSIEDGKSLVGGVGNGGFSLRKISFNLDVYKWRLPLLRPSFLFKKYFKVNSNLMFCIKLPLIILRCFGYRNSVRYFMESSRYIEQEDIIWSLYLKNSWLKINIPDENIALKFCFEKSPEYLFELNNKKLPFGCHAWEKYNPSFWGNFIKDSSNE